MMEHPPFGHDSDIAQDNWHEHQPVLAALGLKNKNKESAPLYPDEEKGEKPK